MTSNMVGLREGSRENGCGGRGQLSEDWRNLASFCGYCCGQAILFLVESIALTVAGQGIGQFTGRSVPRSALGDLSPTCIICFSALRCRPLAGPNPIVGKLLWCVAKLH
ncbi:hypothetical protein WNZ14_03080 [Hoeflea sp. AS60]|uniref:hypothetical protein n=1 Tax=Hoeflea sp. AS60 TaxID=3135780 RepID=UPI00317E4179